MDLHLFIVIFKKRTDVSKIILKTHYKEKSFEIEMFLKPNELVVKKGQTIA
jgi:hypothetical protein